MAKNTYWMTDGYGAHALVEGAEERDRWKPRGWSESSEPAGTAMVWLRNAATEGRQLFAADVVDTWRALGWEPSAPPEPVDVLHDAHLVDVPEPAPTPAPTEKIPASAASKEK